MKTDFTWVWISAVFALFSVAPVTPVHAKPGACETLAAQTARSKFSGYFFRHGKRIRSIDSAECEAKVSKKGARYQFCEIGASTPDGAGDVTFGVNLNETCTRAFAWYVIGQE